MSDITVIVPFAKRYLAQYVKGKYGYGYNEPILASTDTDIGKLIKSLLGKTPSNFKQKEELRPHIVFVLPYYNDLNVRVYNYLSQNSHDLINTYVRNLFYLEIRDVLTEAISNKIPIKNAIYMFCEGYGISLEDDDATYEAIKKDFYRYRKKHTSKNLISVCSSFSIFL